MLLIYFCTLSVLFWILHCLNLYTLAYYSVHLRLSLGTSFNQQAAGAVLDIEGDEGADIQRPRSHLKWSVIDHMTS